jgi:hypothetical protein
MLRAFIAFVETLLGVKPVETNAAAWLPESSLSESRLNASRFWVLTRASP